MLLHLNIKEIISVSLVLFAVIDILGSIPIIISLNDRGVKLDSGKATFVAGAIMILFLLLGDQILKLIGIDVHSFSVAGALVIFILGMEMILGIELFKNDPTVGSASVVPIAFPLIAGAGTLTTILSLKAEYEFGNIFTGIILNLVFVYLVLKATPWIQKKIGRGGTLVIRRIFGVILLSIAIKLFTSNIGHLL